MIPVSDAYKELVKSNIRPKCEPIIKISGKDNTGKDIELIWRAKNIKDLTYKRGIDPVGRELPYMELTWTEIYTGELNAQSYPEKYNNVTKYMAVELSFIQDLGFYNTWKTIFNSGTTWKELFSKNSTWKQIKNSVSQEVITMPKLFLSARPTISGQTITWVAKDLLSYVNETQTIQFMGDRVSGITLKNVISYFMLNARGSFCDSLDLFKAYTETVTNLLSQDNIQEVIDKRIICDGNTNDIILNLASIYNYYMDFKNDIVAIYKFNPSKIDFVFDKKTMYSYPQIEKIPNISSYSFKHRIAERDVNRAYYKSPTRIKSYKNNTYVLYYNLNGYGDAYNNENIVEIDDTINKGDIDVAILVGTYADPNEKIYVVPINYNSYDNIINVDDVGETFFEDNPINPYDLESDVAISRKDFLRKYFSNSSSVISFESLANVAIETNDIIQIDTNLYDNDGERIKKMALVVEIELNYNGSFKQKIKAHEVFI